MWKCIRDSIIAIIALIILTLLIVSGVNMLTSSDWNDGDCPDCEVRYELRAASKGLKYYACPECGREVQRY